MSSTPWTIQRTKRKQPLTTPAPRKRVRISDDTRPKAASDGRPAQRTLTQIQWVNNPTTSFGKHVKEQGIQSEGQKSRASTSRKSKSTLTQMDWFARPTIDVESASDEMDLLPKLPNTNRRIPQFDGAKDLPPSSKGTQSILRSNPPRSSSPTTPEYETQDYQPRKRQKGATSPATKSPTPRRRSERVAAKLSSQVNDDDNTSAVKPMRLSKTPVKPRSSRRHIEEIGDSDESEGHHTVRRLQSVPQTPVRQREIPSSQTPETVLQKSKPGRSTRLESPSKVYGRTPLREKSANIKSKPYPKDGSVLKRAQRLIKTPSQRRKVCVLKMPTPEILPRAACEEESQGKDHTPSQQSSSSKQSSGSKHMSRNSPSPKTDVPCYPENKVFSGPLVDTSNVTYSTTIPSSPPGVTIDESSMERTRTSTTAETCTHNQDSHVEAKNGNSVSVRDFAHMPDDGESQTATPKVLGAGARAGSADEMLLDHNEFTPNIRIVEEASIDSGSDLGSPVANDTQFNLHLEERTSSPSVVGRLEESSATPRKAQLFAPTSQSQGSIARLDEEEVEAEVTTTAPIVTPKLIQRSANASGVEHSSAEEMSHFSALPALDIQSNNCGSTSKIPLNDSEQPASSSSPSLPPVRLGTQRSIYPASLPHLSQISTQEPTQYPLFSSMHSATQTQGEIDRFTIKDSSSVRLSQIPQHHSQDEEPNLHFVDESADEDFEDLDLDPSSAPQGRRSAKKSSLLLRKETGSSLRSIHKSSSKSSDQDVEMVLSSSPSLQASKPRRPPPVTNIDNRNNERQGEHGHVVRLEQPEPNISFPEISSPVSSPSPPPLKRKYDPLPGFDNNTQSNFTQNGHVTAAYVRRQQEAGRLPSWFVPDPHQVSGYTRSKRRKHQE